MRGALLLLDFEDLSSDTLKGLLLRCAMSTRFIGGSNAKGDKEGGSEGRRFLVFLFGLHPSLVDGLHATIRNQLPLAPRKYQAAYGDLYLRAWKNAAAPPAATKKDAKDATGSGLYRRLIEQSIQVRPPRGRPRARRAPHETLA